MTLNLSFLCLSLQQKVISLLLSFINLLTLNLTSSLYLNSTKKKWFQLLFFSFLCFCSHILLILFTSLISFYTDSFKLYVSNILYVSFFFFCVSLFISLFSSSSSSYSLYISLTFCLPFIQHFNCSDLSILFLHFL